MEIKVIGKFTSINKFIAAIMIIIISGCTTKYVTKIDDTGIDIKQSGEVVLSQTKVVDEVVSYYVLPMASPSFGCKQSPDLYIALFYIYFPIDVAITPIYWLSALFGADTSCVNSSRASEMTLNMSHDEAISKLNNWCSYGNKFDSCEKALWLDSVNKDTIEAYKKYLDSYPQGIYSAIASDRYKRLFELSKLNADTRKLNEAIAGGSIDNMVKYLDSSVISYENYNKGLELLADMLIKQNATIDTYNSYYLRYPDIIDYYGDQVRFQLAGPEGMRVYQISRLIMKGTVSTDIIASKILVSDMRYKDYSLTEIEELKGLGITDNIISAMIRSNAAAAKREMLESKRQKLNDMRKQLNAEKDRINREAENEHEKQKQADNDRQKEYHDDCVRECDRIRSRCDNKCNSIATSSLGKSLGAAMAGAQYNNLNDTIDRMNCNNECSSGYDSCTLRCN